MARDYLRQLRTLTVCVAEVKAQHEADVDLIHADVDGVQLVVDWYCFQPCSNVVND